MLRDGSNMMREIPEKWLSLRTQSTPISVILLGTFTEQVCTLALSNTLG